jgi:pimeloyl-ACP methyl ester carboxylesterase
MILSHSKVAGNAPPERWMLMMHGIYGSGRNWGTIARRLVEQRPEWGCVLVDLRMHGDSQGFEPPHTLEAAAKDVDALADELALPVEAVLGHSFGGKVALVYTRRHAEELKQTWVIDSTLEVREPSGSAWRVIDIVRSLPEEFASREELAVALEEHGYARPVGNWLAMNLERADGGFRWRLDWDGIEQMLRDYFDTDVWEVIEQPPSGVELHLVKATESDAIDEGSAARIHKAAAGGASVELHRLEGGHWLNTENPDGVVELLARELA